MSHKLVYVKRTWGASCNMTSQVKAKVIPSRMKGALSDLGPVILLETGFQKHLAPNGAASKGNAYQKHLLASTIIIIVLNLPKVPNQSHYCSIKLQALLTFLIYEDNLSFPCMQISPSLTWQI